MPLTSQIEEIINKLTEAITIEIASIGRYPRNITARNGKLLHQTGNTYIYIFELETIESIPDDTNTSITINGRKITATIISSYGLEIQISFNEYLGETIKDICLQIENSLLLQSLKKLLHKIRIGEIEINESLALKLFGVNAKAEDTIHNIFYPPLSFDLDSYQKDVIEKTINSDLSFIWGPPGTGKTVIISFLAQVFIKSNLTVLITSNTNIAVDNVFEKFIEFFKDTSSDLLNGQIIRYGNIQKEEIRELVQESFIIERLAKSLYEELNTLETNISTLSENQKIKKELIQECKNYLDTVKLQTQLNQQLLDLIKEKEKNEKEHNELEHKILVNEEELEILNAELILSKETFAPIRLVRGIRSEKTLNKNISISKNSLHSNKLKLAKTLNCVNATKNEIEQIESNIKNSEIKISEFKEMGLNIDTLNVKKIEAEIKITETKIDELNDKVIFIRAKITEIENDLIKEAKVIGTTLSMFHSRANLYERKFDVIIIDEATMANQPQLFFAACFAKKKVIVVGDFYQLQSIVQTQNNTVIKDWFKKDIFRKNNIENEHDPRLNILKIQRRMKSPIAEISNKCIYNGILEHSPFLEKLCNEPAVTFYNTSLYKPYATIPGDKGRVNVYNAVLAVKLAEKYCYSDEIYNIGIISPYRKQALLISKMVKDLELSNKVSCDTVYKFQGLEKDLIIFDITDGYNTRGYRIGANLRDHTEAPYLFNVAFTRAKNKLIVIGDLEYLRINRQDLPEKVKKMFACITKGDKNNYEIIDSGKILKEFNYENYSTQNNSLKHFSEESFYKDFIYEISLLQKTLKIYSPFIAVNRVKQNFNLNFFRNVLARNISIKIITKPTIEHPVNNREFAKGCIDEWKKIGIEVTETPLMHEKIAILDDRTIYYGSLNILSQWRSQETMLKFCGTNSLKELIKIYN
ncbi:MAG: AAA family ATPase [Ignavibacteria bacterium]|nr:AAA family ATPase [Ignavibacteria bacterium]